MAKVNRRNFIKISSAAVGGAAVAGGLTTDWYGVDNPAGPVNPNTDGDKVVTTFCELCFWKCGILAHVKDGVVTKLQGNPKHPLSRGRLCPRGVGGTGLLYDPDRLSKPLIRVKGTKRGEDTFREATWEEAIEYTANGLRKVMESEAGPQATALFQHGYGASWFKQLFGAMGSPNIAAPSFAQCRGARAVGFELTYGVPVGSPERVDMENADAIMLIGSHIGENMHNTQVQDFARAVGKGAKIVVVDPRFSTAAGKADKWLPIKPGTDIAFLLAVMNVIINENLYDKQYVETYVNDEIREIPNPDDPNNPIKGSGFELLKKHVATKTPEWAYARTGIKPEDIREVARMLGAAKPAVVVHPGRRTAWYGDDTQRTRAIAILTALLGSWGRKGGYLVPQKLKVAGFKKPPSVEYETADRSTTRGYPLASDTLANGLCDATIPGNNIYDLKAWMVYGTNLPFTLPEPKKTYDALQKLDFVVAIDVLPSEICGWADVVLPECTYLERTDDIHIPAYKEPFIALRNKVIDPINESKPGWWIAQKIAEKLGFEEFFQYKDSDEFVKNRLEGNSVEGWDGPTYNYEEAVADGVITEGVKPHTFEDGGLEQYKNKATGSYSIFPFPSGKIELHSQELADYGHYPLPVFTQHEEPGLREYRLLVGRSPVHTFARTSNNRLLGQIVSENELWIAPSVAKDHDNLKTGDLVNLKNQDGVVEGPIKVKVTERIRKDCVYMVHGFGHTANGLKFAKGRGASDSALMSRVKIDPVMGGTGINVNFVTIERV